MLFHVTMTHTPDNCPAYHPEQMHEVITSLEQLDERGRELRVTTHALLWAAPAHVAFAVLEANDLGTVARYLNSIAITQDFTITPVQHVSEAIKFGKAAMQR